MPQIPDPFFKAMSGLNRAVLSMSGRRVGSTFFGMPALELTTTGRKSGKQRTVVLTAPIVEGERIVLVASKGGNDDHPDWYRNLVANPEVEITLKGEKRTYKARTATPEERAELWPRITSAYKGYADYEKRTTREIPVVICDPTS